MAEIIFFLIFIILWAICGVIAFGVCFAYFQREFSCIAEQCYNQDRQRALNLAFAGPITLFTLWICGCYTHGLKFK